MGGLRQFEVDGLQAAAVLLAARGHAAVRAEELARAAGMSVGALYRRHGDKEGFVAAVRALAEEELVAMGSAAWRFSWNPASSRAEDFRCAFLTVWHALGGWAVAQPALFAFTFLHHQASGAGSGHASSGQVRELLREVLETGLAQEVVRATSAWVLVGLVWGALLELVRVAQGRGTCLEAPELSAAGEAVWCAIRKPSKSIAGMETVVSPGSVEDRTERSRGAGETRLEHTSDVDEARPAHERCVAVARPAHSLDVDARRTAHPPGGPWTRHATSDGGALPDHRPGGGAAHVAQASGGGEARTVLVRADEERAPERQQEESGRSTQRLEERAGAETFAGSADGPAARAEALASWRPCCPCAARLRPQGEGAPWSAGLVRPLGPATSAQETSTLEPEPGPGDDAAETPVDPARAAALAYHASWKWGTRPEPSVIIGHMAALGFDAECEADVQRAFAEVDRGALDFDFVNRWCISQVHVQRDREYERVRQLHEASGGQLSWGEALARVRAAASGAGASTPSEPQDPGPLDGCPVTSSGDAASDREAVGLGVPAVTRAVDEDSPREGEGAELEAWPRKSW